MCDKRFTLEKVVWDGYCIKDNVEQTYYVYDTIDLEKLCEICNDLYDENLLLKGEVGHYKLLLYELNETAKRMSRIK